MKLSTTLKSSARRLAVVAVAAPALALGLASPALATGAVANSCAVTAPVTAAKSAPGGVNVYSLKCGEAMGGLKWATVHGHPFYVKVAGQAPRCYKAGTLFHPNNKGFERTAVITPTVRCRS